MYQNRYARFTGADPLLTLSELDNPQTFNRYAYVGNNPVNFNDPTGLSWCRKKGSTETEFTGVGAPCKDGWKNIDNTTGLIGGGPIWGPLGASPGDVVRFLPNGKVYVLDPANPEDLPDYARATGAEVVADPDLSITTEAGSPGGIFPTGSPSLPTVPFGSQLCPFGFCRPVMDQQTQQAMDVVSIGLTVCGLVFDPCDLAASAVDTAAGDSTSAAMDLAAAVPIAGLPVAAAKISRKLNRLAKAIHENSKLSRKAQHVYHITEAATGAVVKTGVSGGKIAKNGKSLRAEAQVRKWNRKEGANKYGSRVVKKIPPGPGARTKAMAAEVVEANKHRQTLDRSKHKRP